MCILSDADKTRNNLTDDDEYIPCYHCCFPYDRDNMYFIDDMYICSKECIIEVYEIKKQLAQILMGEILKGE